MQSRLFVTSNRAMIRVHNDFKEAHKWSKFEPFRNKHEKFGFLVGYFSVSGEGILQDAISLATQGRRGEIFDYFSDVFAGRFLGNIIFPGTGEAGIEKIL